MGRIFEFITNTTDGVFAVDRRQVIVLWNEAATSILGFTPGEVLGRRCYEIIDGYDDKACAVCRRACEVITAAERLELPPTMDIATRTKRGDEMWVNVTRIVVPSRRRELSVLIQVFREVTRHHKLRRIAGALVDVMSGSPDGRREPPPRERSSARAPVDLTPREREVMGQLMKGVTTEVIADRLHISPRTVRNHVSNILGKLGVHSRLEAVTYSIQHRLV